MKRTFLVLTGFIFIAACGGGGSDRSTSSANAEPLAGGVVCSDVDQQIVDANFCAAIDLVEKFKSDCSVDDAKLLADKVAGIINAAKIFPLPVLSRSDRTIKFDVYDLFMRSAEATVAPLPDPCLVMQIPTGYKAGSFECAALKSNIFSAFKCPGMDASINQNYFAKAFAKYLVTRNYSTKTIDVLEPLILSIITDAVPDARMKNVK